MYDVVGLYPLSNVQENITVWLGRKVKINWSFLKESHCNSLREEGIRERFSSYTVVQYWKLNALCCNLLSILPLLLSVKNNAKTE